MGFADSSVLAKVCLLVLPIGGLFVIIGLATPYWTKVSPVLGVDPKVHEGLWKYCAGGSCVTLSSANTKSQGWFLAVRAMVIMSLISGLAGIALHVLSIVKSDMKALKVAALLTTLMAGLFAIIGVGIFGGKYQSTSTPAARQFIKLSWSLILTALGGVIKIIGGILLAVNMASSQ